MSRHGLAVGVLVAALCAARPATADDLWTRLAVTAEQDRARREYDRAMRDGDDAVENAVASEIVSVRQRLIDRAIASYELAARARPDEAEPHFRAAAVMHAFFEACESRHPTTCPHVPTHARRARMIEHWDAFERLAPGDPRVAEEVLFERAVTRTKLANTHAPGSTADLEAARDDYDRLLELRPDGDFGAVLGNLAETHMMLGDLDRAIEIYRRSIARGADLSQEYGLAVALDRDEQGSEARAIMAARGVAGLARFQMELSRGIIFFVPGGEELYYQALAAESLGDDANAIELWELFIQSGAHPQFHARARQNRDALLRNRPNRARSSPRRPGLPPLRPPTWRP